MGMHLTPPSLRGSSMELKLAEGRYVYRQNFGLERVSGAEELKQRVLMKLTARRGEFAPLPEFGSRLHTLSRVPASRVESEARRFVAEALAGETELSLGGLSFVPDGRGGGELLLSFSYNGDESFNVESRI